MREHDWAAFAGLPRKPIALLAAHVYVCSNCGAQTESDAISDRCRFCGAAVVAQVDPADQVRAGGGAAVHGRPAGAAGGAGRLGRVALVRAVRA